MAEFKIPRIRFTWKGDWTSGHAYTKDDIIRYHGKSYVCLVGHTASEDFNTDLDYIDVTQTPNQPAPFWTLWFDGYEWRSNWTTNRLYNLGDYVKYGSIIYICTVSHTSAATPALGLEADISSWTVYAKTDDWLKDWTVNTRYKLNDVVRYGGTLYKCNTYHTSAATAILGLEADLIKWTAITYGFDWHTDWSVSTQYKLGDVVRYGGIIYKCTLGHISASSTTVGIDPDLAKWTIVHSGLDFKFAWAGTTRYKLNDIVKYGADLFICVSAHTSTSSFNNVYWSVWLPGLEFVNSWDSAIYYIQGDIVTYGGYQYVSNTTNNHNNTPSTDLVNWTLLVKNYNIRDDWSILASYKTGDLVRRDGYLYVAIADSTGVETTNESFWTLVNPGIQWKGHFVGGSTYVIGDVVTYYASAYICIAKTDGTTTPLADLNIQQYWTLYVKGDQFETLLNQGDIQTYNNGGWSAVAIGNTGDLLKVSKDNSSLLPVPAWGVWGSLGGVYYVATTGTDLPTYGTTMSTPWRTVQYACNRVTGPATIFIKTGTYNEQLPISVPAGVALVGDELRGTVIQPARTINLVASSSSSSTNTITLNTTVGLLPNDPVHFVPTTFSVSVTATAATGNAITVGNTAGFYVGMPVVFSGGSFGGISPGTTYYVLTYSAATFAITISTSLNGPTFAVSDATGTMTLTAGIFAGLTPGQTYYIIGSSITSNSIQVSYTSGNSTPVQLTDMSNQAVPMYGSYSASDMFYVRNGCGIRNMTLRGLTGGLLPANAYGTRRPTAGAFVSLDPGSGTSDATVQITTKSPYVQNVTTFGQGATGCKIDGSLHNAGNRSIVSNDFTQVISDGIGVWCTGHNALTELVSVFTYYGHLGYLAEAGGKIRATNGNTSYGNYGCVAEGYDITESPIAGTVNNRNQQAQIAAAFIGEATNKILKLEYSNAGQNYTTATYNFAGAGSGAVVVTDELRDNAVYEVRLTGTNYSAGGTGYITAGNQAQAGDTRSITIASNDQNTFATYNGMRVIVTSGTGVGQYGYVAYYDAVGKVVTVGKESIDQLTSLSTNGANNTIVVPSTATIAPGQAIVLVPNQQVTTAYATSHTVATITAGYIVGTTLFVVSVGGGAISTGMVITGGTILANTYITGNISGTGAGSRWTINQTQNVGTQLSTIPISGTNDLVQLSSTIGMIVSEQITFTGSTFGGIVNGTTYYILAILGNSVAISATYNGSRFAVSNATGLATATAGGMLGGLTAGQVYYIISSNFTSTAFSVSTSLGGSAATIATQTYGTTMQVCVLGWENINPGTPPVALLDSTSVYSIEPSIKFSSPSYTTANATLPSNANWISIAYGGGYFVAITTNGLSAFSVNGSAWTSGGNLPAGTWSSVTYTSNAFVAVASGSTAAASTVTNGASWTSATSLTASVAAAYGSGKLMAISSGTAAQTTPDNGQTWNSITVPAGTWTSVAYGSIGTWVIVGTSSSTAAYSTDGGTTWNTVNLPVSANWTSVTWGNGRFVAVATAGANAAYSFDGITWYGSTMSSAANWSCVRYGQGVFQAVATNTTTTATSQDGLVWKAGSLGASNAWSSIAFGNPNSSPVWVVVATSSSSVQTVVTGARAFGRVSVANNKISLIKIWEPGSGYTLTPTVTITDPNATSAATTFARVGSGVLGNPTFVNRGINYRTSTTVVTVQTGDGFADIYQSSKYLTVSGLPSMPTPGAALTIAGSSIQYRIVVINDLGSGKALFQVSPPLSIDVAPGHGTPISIRQKYSQCRITGHDFLLIGTGNSVVTNYPNVDVTTATQYTQIAENNGGRVFQTSTDQDGNYKVGNLFGVQQASGIVTISADQLSLTGLQSISLGGFSLGTNAIVVTQFSTDSYFTANSDSIVPTQKAIKSYIARNIAGGGANAQAGAVVAGTFGVGGPNKIYSSTQTQLFAKNSVRFVNSTVAGKTVGGVSGTMLAKTFFAHGFGSPGSGLG